MAPEPIERRRVLRGVGALGGAGLAVSIAGCSGQAPGGGATETPEPTATTAPPEDASDATVKVASNPTLGDVLVDTDGNSLYMFTPDEQGASTCYDDCASAWPPLTVESEADLSAGSGVTAPLSTTERDDGSLQVTAGDWPLYYFARDEAAGQARGQEVLNVWFALRPDGSPLKPTVSTREIAGLGEVLTDADGMTLYVFDPDEGGESTCYGDCASAWPPLTVEGEDAIVESVGTNVGLGTTERDDGTLQVTATDWPLYYFQGDGARDDANGQGVNDVWWVLGADGTVMRGTSTPTPTPATTTTSSGGGGSDGGDGGGGYGDY